MKIKKIYKIFKKNETSTTPQQKGEGDRNKTRKDIPPLNQGRWSKTGGVYTNYLFYRERSPFS